MQVSTIRLWLGVLMCFVAFPAPAVSLRVGVGTGCDQATLLGALNVIRTQAGTHTIRINKGNYAVPDGMVYYPAVLQTAVFLEGGYDSCTAPAPTGDPTNDSNRAVFSGAGGLPRSVFDLWIYGKVGTFQIRRIALTGGDAFNVPGSDIDVGGGLAIRGPASVLIGLGAAIRNNGASYGGGVALVGGQVHTGNVVDMVDLFIDEGASIASNSATENGGGIYCGGANFSSGGTNDAHGTIFFLDGTILGNSAKGGAAFWCMGSVEGGGGFLPKPRPDRVAWILGNTGAPGLFSCAGGYGTLDRSLPAGPDGVRTVGADAGSNGLLAVTTNNGKRPALCLRGSFTLGSNNIPVGASNFRLNNLYVADQSGTEVLGLSVESNLSLDVGPSGDNVACSLFGPTPCVSVSNNNADSAATPVSGGDPLLRATFGAQLSLTRARIADNQSSTQLLLAENGGYIRLGASIVTTNQVGVNANSPSLGTQLARSRLDGKIRLDHSTLMFATPIDRFFRIEDTSSAVVLASVLASTAATAPANFGGGAPAANFTRERCGYFRRTDDLAGTTVINDPTLGTFFLASGVSPQLNPVTFAPTSSLLTDRCTTSPLPNRDYYGKAFGQQYYPASTVFADIGAVEAQLPNDVIFANGFD